MLENITRATCCKFFDYVVCIAPTLCDNSCVHHPFNPNFMCPSERDELAEACAEWCRANGLDLNIHNVIHALYYEKALNSPAASSMISRYSLRSQK